MKNDTRIMEEKDKHFLSFFFNMDKLVHKHSIFQPYICINFDLSLCQIGSIMFNFHIVTDVDLQRNHTLQQLLEWLIPGDGYPLY